MATSEPDFAYLCESRFALGQLRSLLDRKLFANFKFRLSLAQLRDSQLALAAILALAQAQRLRLRLAEFDSVCLTRLQLLRLRSLRQLLRSRDFSSSIELRRFNLR